jgi:Family of unknown function (DUF6301)
VRSGWAGGGEQGLGNGGEVRRRGGGGRPASGAPSPSCPAATRPEPPRKPRLRLQPLPRRHHGLAQPTTPDELTAQPLVLQLNTRRAKLWVDGDVVTEIPANLTGIEVGGGPTAVEFRRDAFADASGTLQAVYGKPAGRPGRPPETLWRLPGGTLRCDRVASPSTCWSPRAATPTWTLGYRSDRRRLGGVRCCTGQRAGHAGASVMIVHGPARGQE